MNAETYYNWNRTDSSVMYIDTVENAIDSLETTLFYFDRKDNLKWKWIVLALHHSLYSFCVANLSGSNYHNVISSGFDEDNNFFMKKENDPCKKSRVVKRLNSQGYTIEWDIMESEPSFLNKNGKKRKEKLIGFWIALARVQDKEFWMARYTFSKHLKLTEEEWKSIEWLTEGVRNELTHFIPMGLGIKTKDVKNACLNIIRPIEFLALEANQLLYTDDNSKERIKNSLKDIRVKLQS